MRLFHDFHDWVIFLSNNAITVLDDEEMKVIQYTVNIAKITCQRLDASDDALANECPGAVPRLITSFPHSPTDCVEICKLIFYLW